MSGEDALRSEVMKLTAQRDQARADLAAERGEVEVGKIRICKYAGPVNEKSRGVLVVTFEIHHPSLSFSNNPEAQIDDMLQHAKDALVKELHYIEKKPA